ncbi:MAG: hypothetical protein ACRD2L_09465, partial [Terriglobia bacterium]
ENPDAIKNLWNETPEEPEDIEFDPDNYEVKIIIIAPSFEPSALRLKGSINFEVDLIEVNRWVHRSNHLLLVNTLAPESKKRTGAVHGRQLYDEEYYRERHNHESVAAFLKYAREIQAVVRSKGWQLDMKPNQNYIGFKHGFFNVFGIHWLGTRSFDFFFKLPKSIAVRTQPRSAQMHSYSDRFNQASYKIKPGKTKTRVFLPLFQKSLDHRIGKED